MRIPVPAYPRLQLGKNGGRNVVTLYLNPVTPHASTPLQEDIYNVKNDIIASVEIYSRYLKYEQAYPDHWSIMISSHVPKVRAFVAILHMLVKTNRDLDYCLNAVDVSERTRVYLRKRRSRIEEAQEMLQRESQYALDRI